MWQADNNKGADQFYAMHATKLVFYVVGLIKCL